MQKNTFFPLEASHESFSGTDTEMAMPGTRTYHQPERVGALFVARRVTLNYEGCLLQVGSVEVLGHVMGLKLVPHKGKPCLKVLTMETSSEKTREVARLKVAEHFRVLPEEVYFYNGKTLERTIYIIED